MINKWIGRCMVLGWCLCICISVGAADLRKGSMGPYVLALQQELSSAGYLAREADEEFGSAAEKALRLFQRDAGLTVTGVADRTTREVLRQHKSGRRGGGVLYAPGNVGDEVRALQQRLLACGYLDDVADGVYGDKLTAAVQRLQREHGLEVIGAVDEETWRILGGMRSTVSRGGSVKGLRGQSDKTQVKAAKKADTHEINVLRLQSLLIQNGYDPGTVDGVFGGATERALMAWQRAHGVAATGVADTYFWQSAGVLAPVPSRYVKKWQMHSSAYSNQDSDTGSHTARGSRLVRGHVAVDPNVIPLGSMVYVEGYGYALADDIGGAIQGQTIDVAMDSYDEAIHWGRRDVTVYLISEPNA